MLIRYLYFWFHSSNQHGVHSPFVFDLVSHCFFNKDWKKIKFFPFTNDQYKSLDRQFQERLKNYFSHKVSTTQTLYTLKFVTKDTDVKKLSAESNCIWVFSGLHSDRSQWVQVSSGGGGTGGSVEWADVLNKPAPIVNLAGETKASFVQGGNY